MKPARQVHDGRRVSARRTARAERRREHHGSLTPLPEESTVKYDEFISRVAESVGVSRAMADVLSRSVLGILADRITGGEARDLARQLPVPLQNPLLPAREEAEAFDFEEFIRRTMERAGVDRNTAVLGIGAVLATLRDATDPDEFGDVVSQLPEDFKRVRAPQVN
ncbi:hypothetical protein GCM10029964_054120 [Kibdelosporangium lantanae]